MSSIYGITVEAATEIINKFSNDVLDNGVIIGQADEFDTEEFIRKFNSPFLRTLKH